MPVQSLIWTVLPNGLTADGRDVRFSLLLSPRLEPQNAAPRLSSFADFANWPATLARAKITVSFGDAAIPIEAAHVDASIGVPDSQVWLAMFPASTAVRSFKMTDHTATSVLSFDAVAMHDVVRNVYASLTASAGEELPSIGDLREQPALKPVIEGVAAVDGMRGSLKKPVRDIGGEYGEFTRSGFKGLKGAGTMLATFQLFHTPLSKQSSQTHTPADERNAVTWRTHERAEIDAADFVASLDFHRIVSAMNQYPVLLRKLGLVLDYVVPVSGLRRTEDAPLSVRVDLPPGMESSGASNAVTRRDASPQTRASLSDSRFEPVSRPAADTKNLRVRSRLLRMDPARVALLQADVDGSALKLMNFARSLVAHEATARQVDAVSKLPRRTGAPALRNGGLMLVHRGRGASLTDAFWRNDSLNTRMEQLLSRRRGAVVNLFAEDLVRGWRLDVWDQSTTQWRSLCERLAGYTISGNALTLSGVREEGTVRLAATSAADGSNPNIMSLHEIMAVWRGWSLVAPAPGLSVGTDDEVADPSPVVPDGIPLRTSFVAAPGTLPRLRYGRVYAVRARVVDLAGNSLPPSTSNYSGDEESRESAAPYWRYEPVAPPLFALVGDAGSVEAPGPGESMARMAIRTFNDVFDDPTPSAEIARRWSLSPRVSQREAELHGVCDGPGWGGAAQYALLSTRDAEPPVLKLATRGGGAVSYTALPADAVALPYLPDPLSTRVAARLLDYPWNGPPELITIPLYAAGASWPDVSPILLRVYEAERERPRFDDATRTLLIPAPKGLRARLRLSAMLDDDALALLGVWNWVPAAERTAALARRARAGAIWSLTPWREMEIVHAVQRPLRTPKIDELMLERPRGATWVRPSVKARVHRMTTDRIDLMAAWNDPTNGGVLGSPGNAAKTDLAFSVKITDPQGYAGITQHMVPDASQPDRIVFGPVLNAVFASETEARPQVHDFGDTRYRRVEYRLVGTSRFPEYVPAPVQTPDPREPRGLPAGERDAERLTVTSAVERVWAPSSAPPPAPEVLYVVPTFGWTRASREDGRQTSWRRGSGLRVWLDRPWNASGYGEMLAVVLPPEGQPITPDAAPYKDVVTQWGNDPVWTSPYVDGVAPVLSRFPRARLGPDATGAWLPPDTPAVEADQPAHPFRTRSIPHAGLPVGWGLGLVDVAPHDVAWDADRKLWYCDIEIRHGESYFPFVRLALARYQPTSVDGAWLSTVVLCEFSALAPDRWLAVQRSSATKRAVTVHGHRPEQSSGYAEAWQRHTEAIGPDGEIRYFIPTGIAKTNVVEVWVEQLNPARGEDFGWVRVADSAITPPARARPSSRPRRVEARSDDARAEAVAITIVRNAAGEPRARELVERRDYEAVVAENLVDATMAWPVMWDGTVTLPEVPSAAKRFRLVVAEYEEFITDEADPYDGTLTSKGRRLVYVEHVELT
ncbi:hypothetical protein [Gemmatimonas sp.]|uniref:hypothetical protein n=1 Tax=Gemmatimonas sp. TaxID=1962908 RepID=UPI00286D4A3E|nr:hypothetical protein [Gemmatimonas sp.]